MFIFTQIVKHVQKVNISETHSTNRCKFRTKQKSKQTHKMKNQSSDIFLSSTHATHFLLLLRVRGWGVRGGSTHVILDNFGAKVDLLALKSSPHVIFAINIDFELWIKHLLGMSKRLSTFVELQNLESCDFLTVSKPKIRKQNLFPKKGSGIQKSF